MEQANNGLPEAEKVIALSAAWFRGRGDVSGLVLVGSYARGAARPGSDLDLVIVCAAPERYRADHAWPGEMPWGEIGLAVTQHRDQDYGKLWSRHVLLSSGLEVEYGFTTRAWATTRPLDAGTEQVLSAGHRLVYDRNGDLQALSDYLRLRAGK